MPLSLVSGYELRTDFESGLGVGIAGDLPPGPVTVMRLGGPDLGQLWRENGMALVAPPRPGQCRTQLDARVAPISLEPPFRDRRASRRAGAVVVEHDARSGRASVGGALTPDRALVVSVAERPTENRRTSPAPRTFGTGGFDASPSR